MSYQDQQANQWRNQLINVQATTGLQWNQLTSAPGSPKRTYAGWTPITGRFTITSTIQTYDSESKAWTIITTADLLVSDQLTISEGDQISTAANPLIEGATNFQVNAQMQPHAKGDGFRIYTCIHSTMAWVGDKRGGGL